MNKIQKFKEIATNLGEMLKKYWFYKQNLKSYLNTREFSETQFQEIERNLSLNLSLESYIEKSYNKNMEEDSKTAFIKLLMIESFYNNHELFKKINQTHEEFDLIKEAREVLFRKSFNELVKTINYEELNKNLTFLNDSKFNILVLEKAFISSNQELYDFIYPFIDWKKDNKDLKTAILLNIVQKGKVIKRSNFSEYIKSYIEHADIIEFFTTKKQYFINKDVAKNIDEFFEIDIIKELINNEGINKELHFFSFKNEKKELQNIFHKIDKEKDYTHIINDYLISKFEKVKLVDKLTLLNEENLLTKEILDKLIKKENSELLSVLFLHQNKLAKHLKQEEIEKINAEYKLYIQEKCSNKDTIDKFIEFYPKELKKEELINLIVKRYGYFNEKNQNQNDKYVLEDQKKEIKLVNLIFSKHCDWLIEKETIQEITNKTRNDFFLKYYIEKLTSIINSEDNWEELLNKQNKNLLKYIFNHTDDIKFLSSHTMVKVINEYKDVILNSMFETDEVINFVEKYPYELTKEEIIKVLDRNNQYFKVTCPIEEEAVKIVQNKYLGELNIDNMLETNKFFPENIAQEEKELVNVFLKKYSDILYDKNTLLEIVKTTSNDLFLSIYLNKIFENNNDQDLKLEVAQNCNIFAQNNFSNTLQWIVDNNLLNEIIPINENVSTNKNLLTNKSWNGWVPLLIEKFDIKPDGLIKETVASFVSNDELFKFILNNYELKEKTKQSLCNSVFSINSVELAEELFKNGVFPNDYLEQKFKDSPTQAGNVLLKAKLKEKLEQKFDLIEQDKSQVSPIKKIKKI